MIEFPPERLRVRGTVDRRRLLRGSLALASLACASRAAGQALPQSAIQTVLGEGQRFDAARIADLARVLAKRPFAPVLSDLPEAFASLTYDQYNAIRAQPTAVTWAGEGRGFSIEPLHRGFLFSNPVLLYVVEDETVRRIAYDRAKFDFGRLAVPATLGDLGFSGFRVFAAVNGDRPLEMVVFQGATFFRAIARGQNFGVVARTLTLRPGETRGEEIPIFRAFWIERPNAGSGSLIVNALLDSESMTGAVHFTLRPGDITIIDVEATLFARVAVDHVGLGGMNSTFLFGPNDRIGVDDIRQAVHDAKGLQMLNGHGEWIWRPLANPATLQISAFLDNKPKGFGLLQKDRDFSTFWDVDQQFERRPSLWIEPLGDWGEGAVQLIEIPTDAEINDNIISYWRPRQPLAAGSETSFAYRQFWCWTPPERPSLATVTQTRTGRGSSGRRRRFTVDFFGETLGEARAVVEAKPNLSATPGAVHNVRVWPFPERKALRVGFELDPGNEPMSELRLVLEGAGKPLSETWLYRWTP